MFRIKNGYSLWQMPETMKFFCSTKKLINKTKNRKNEPSLEVFKVLLAQCNLVDNQCQQTSEVLYTFTQNKFYAYFFKLVFLKTRRSF